MVCVEIVYFDVVAIHEDVSEKEASPKPIIFHSYISLKLINITLPMVDIEGIGELLFEFGNFSPDAAVLHKFLLIKFLNYKLVTVVARVR